MDFYTKRELIGTLEMVDEDTKVALYSHSCDVLFFDFEIGITVVDGEEVLYISSEELDSLLD
jgi:hypothetical protein